MATNRAGIDKGLIRGAKRRPNSNRKRGVVARMAENMLFCGDNLDVLRRHIKARR